MIHFDTVSNVVGAILVIVGASMLTALPFSYYYDSGDALAIIYSSVVTMSCGALSWWWKLRSQTRIGKREGYLIVVLAWFSIALFSTLPYLFSGVIPRFHDAIFESVSGLTTTGASVLIDIEAVPKGILFWRSLTQWIGGMGVIVLTVAIFPLLGIGGVELFTAEAPGPTSDKLHPRIKETAKRLWLIYVSLTALLMVILYLIGMTFYDAINHALTTMATGGFSTKNASVAHFKAPSIQYTILLFMFLAGTNYTIIYYGLKGKFAKAWRSEEFKTYILLVIGLVALIGGTLSLVNGVPVEQSFRAAGFQVVSLITTTGFVSADYTSWSPWITTVCFTLLFTGACAGSTAGGVKLIRLLVSMKNSIFEFKRLLHPNAMIRVKVDRKVVPPAVLTHILVFVLVYMVTFIFGSIAMSAILSDFEAPFLTAIGAVATSLGNVGPAIGEVGPMDNFALIPPVGKWLLSFLMLLGRLELFTILILFTPYFWKTN